MAVVNRRCGSLNFYYEALGMGLLSKKVPKAEDVYNAVKTGNVAEVTKLLHAGGSPEKHEDAFVRHGRPLQPRLALHTKRCLLHALLAKPSPQTADVCLHVAANKGRTEILNLLIEHKADVNRQNKARATRPPADSHTAASQPRCLLRTRAPLVPDAAHVSDSSARRRCTVLLDMGTTRS